MNRFLRESVAESTDTSLLNDLLDALELAVSPSFSRSRNAQSNFLKAVRFAIEHNDYSNDPEINDKLDNLYNSLTR